MSSQQLTDQQWIEIQRRHELRRQSSLSTVSILAIVEACFHEDGSRIATEKEMESALRAILALVTQGKQGD